MENPIKMDDFGGTTIFGNIHMAARLFVECLHLHLFSHVNKCQACAKEIYQQLANAQA